jgi:hypothetical protein
MTRTRGLTAGEWAELSSGLAQALRESSVEPRISNRAHPFAIIAGLWRGETPILALGRTVHWPDAPADLSGARAMSVLQHELQHVLDYATGALTPAGYALLPRNWTYRLPAEVNDWRRLGAEQRAVLAERLWLAERDDPLAAAQLRRVIPWA